jgi:hypothetical protein
MMNLQKKRKNINIRWILDYPPGSSIRQEKVDSSSPTKRT